MGSDYINIAEGKLRKLMFIGILSVYSIFCSFVAPTVKAEVELPIKPTEAEFNVYKYFYSKLWDLPPGRDAENIWIAEVAEKVGISSKDVDTICVKFGWYEMMLGSKDKSYRDGDITRVGWSEAKKLIDMIGDPK